ncbi:response regulator [soil metagenome]
MTGRPHVLVVDDNAINIDLVGFVLDLGGFEVSAAADAPAALALIAARPPALILMDIQMPGADGVVLTQQLKADPATQQIVIVAFTAYAMKDDQAKLLAAGFDGYLSKPINVATFADDVRRCLP